MTTLAASIDTATAVRVSAPTHRVASRRAGRAAALASRPGTPASLGVARTRRRAGLGAALLGRALREARARRCSQVELEVGACNTAALALYRNHRFVAAGRRPRYYRDGEDALLMTRELCNDR